VGQGKFYDGKFTTVNLKKGVNRKTGVKVQCLPKSSIIRARLLHDSEGAQGRGLLLHDPKGSKGRLLFLHDPQGRQACDPSYKTLIGLFKDLAVVSHLLFHSYSSILLLY